MADAAVPIVVDQVSHFFGSGLLRKQILAGVSTEIRKGEIVIMTGPSGSGKTTLLTLIGGLRSTQQGSLKVLGREMNGARQGLLRDVRRHIGFIFQSHNLLRALSARENVLMSLRLHPEVARGEARERARAMLELVGLGERMDHYPDQLSGGQKQRVAIARALVTRPRLILADEPTASLDSKSGRDVVDIMQELAKKQGCTVLLVTHDSRILDIADRVIHLEDGRLASFTSAVTSSAQQMLDALTKTARSGELSHRVGAMSLPQFGALLEQVTGEFEQFQKVLSLSQSGAFQGMLDQVLEAFTLKCGALLGADRATLFIVDAERRELWTKVGLEGFEVRVPIDSGIAGLVARTGDAQNVPDAYAHPLFNRDVDKKTGYRTRSLLCLPLKNAAGQVFAVMQLLNKQGDAGFDQADLQRFAEFSSRIGVILEAWVAMNQRHAPVAAAS